MTVRRLTATVTGGRRSPGRLSLESPTVCNHGAGHCGPAPGRPGESWRPGAAAAGRGLQVRVSQSESDSARRPVTQAQLEGRVRTWPRVTRMLDSDSVWDGRSERGHQDRGPGARRPQVPGIDLAQTPYYPSRTARIYISAASPCSPSAAPDESQPPAQEPGHGPARGTRASPPASGCGPWRRVATRCGA